MLTEHRGLCAEFLAAPKTWMWTGGMGLDLVGTLISSGASLEGGSRDTDTGLSGRNASLAVSPVFTVTKPNQTDKRILSVQHFLHFGKES